MPTKSACAFARVAGSLASFHSGEPWPKTVVMSPFGAVEVFSRTTLAVETAPKSQPARVYGTHGAGVVFGAPLSPFTMFGSGSSLFGATASFQYLNDEVKVGVPSGR